MFRLSKGTGSLTEGLDRPALIVAVVALIAALGGTAYAHAHYRSKSLSKGQITALIKREVRKYAKAGPEGKQGAPGNPGPTGEKGPEGKQGEKGENGTNGKSVVVSPIAAEQGKCEERAGASVKQEGAASATEICDGKEGSPWTELGNLPPGKTLQGDWSIEASSHESSNERFGTHVSFLLPLKEAPTAHYIQEDNKENYYDETAEEFKERTVSECPGNVEEPEATPGNLCVYGSREEGVQHQIGGYRQALPKVCAPGTYNSSAELYEVGIACLVSPRTSDRFGFSMLTIGTGSGFVELGGTWAVTAKTGP